MKRLITIHRYLTFELRVNNKLSGFIYMYNECVAFRSINIRRNYTLSVSLNETFFFLHGYVNSQ
jgi:hypothetical protein